MRVLVKRFCLSYERQIYKAGEIVDIADEKTAKNLIARSGGDLEALGGGVAISAPDPVEPEVGNGLPSIDPMDAVQDSKPPARGKKK